MSLPRLEPFTTADGLFFQESAPWTPVIAGWSLLPNNGGWTHLAQIVTNRVCITSSTVGIWVFDSANSYNADQYAQGVIHFTSSPNYVGVSVRNDTSDPNGTSSNAKKQLYYFEVSPTTGDRYFAKKVAGTETQLGDSLVTVADSDLIRIEASGTTITCKINGSTIFTVTDSSLSSGAAGWGGEGNGATSMFLDDWEGGNLGPAGTPFIPMEFPNPRGKFINPVRGDVLGMSSAIRDSIVQAPLPPGASVEWNPPRAKPYPTELRTFLSFYVIDNSQPFSTTEWPNPSLKRRASTGDMVPLTALNIATAIVTPPIGQSDMGRPQPPGLNRDLRGYVDASEFWMLKDTMFGAQGEPLTPMPEPLPRVKGVTIDLKTWVQNLLLSTLNLPVFAPRVMHDWPVPRVQFYSPALRTWTQSPSLLLKDKIYGAAGEVPAYDWPLPKIGRRIHGDQWVQNLLESTLTPPPAFKPWWAANTNRAIGPLIEPR